jgi:hypothetical protein
MRPPARPGRTQALPGEVWPGHGLPDRNFVEWDDLLMHPLHHGEGQPSILGFRTQEGWQNNHNALAPPPPEPAASFDPRLRIGQNESAQMAEAARQRRAEALAALAASYTMQSGQWR